MSTGVRSDKPNLAGVVLAGGEAVRFGGAKEQALLAGQTLASHAINRLQSQISGPVAFNSNREFAPEGTTHRISDSILARVGPLAGIHSAMVWARSQGFAAVVTTPVDAPFFPNNLALSFDFHFCAVAKFADRLHPVFGKWPVSKCVELEVAIAAGERSVHRWVEICGAVPVDFPEAPSHAFLNINTVEHLQEAERLFHQTIRRGKSQL